jgi:diguanylate cyclase (GGDEF)-like protein/PAS domain S-box-containing protein
MTTDEKKTKRQLIEELEDFRKRIAGVQSIITERRSEFIQMFRDFLNASPVPVIVSDNTQNIVFLNGKFEDTFGFDREEIPTLYDWWCISYKNKSNDDEMAKCWQEQIVNAMKTGQEIGSMEAGVICKDGSKRHIVFRFIPIPMGDRYMIYCTDLTDARRTEDELAQANEKLKVWICELEIQNSRMNLLRRMGEALHACRNTEDASPIIKQYGPQLFPKTNGSLYTLDRSQGKMRSIVKWGNYSDQDVLFPPNDCEALRMGKPLERKESQDSDQKTPLNNCVCSKDNWFGASKCMCIPMKAAGDAQGLLQLGFYDNDDEYERGIKELALVVTEHLALSLANLRLQETLRAQAIRDPLTGLFNRRYMEECLDREFHRAERRNHPVCIVMVDIDHFKMFNDTYGHDAGDALLQLLSAILQKSIRQEDIACRFGGEEFVLILPDMPLDVAIQRAEQLRCTVYDTNFDYLDKDLGKVSISLGVAAFPVHGKNAHMVLKRADDALYKAKNAGRNRVEIAA